MLKENDEPRRESNLNIWHDAGYTGKGVNILVWDFNGKIYDHMKDYVVLIDPEGVMSKEARHNTFVAQVVHEAAPDATVYVTPWTHSSKEITDWLRGNPKLIDIAGASLTTPVTDDFNIFKELDIPFTASSGNDSDKGKNGVNFPANLDWNIAVGAYNWKDKGVNSNDVTGYSNGGEELDCVSLTNIYVQNEDGTYIHPYSGTSTSRPWLDGKMGCYIQWRKEHGLPRLTQAMAKKFVRENCIDIKAKGFDYDSGHGLFCLPATIPIVEVKPIEPTPDPIKEKEIITMPRIYISPSTQQDNIGISPFRTEETEMNAIADILVQLLDDDGRFEFKRNSPSMSPNQCAYDSNAFKSDIHLAIHSNAGGGVGTEVYAYAPNTNSEKLSKCLYNKISPLSPGKDRGVKFNKNLIEVGDTVNATSSLIELAFHDNKADATWIANNHQAIAQSLYMGLCDYFGYSYKEIVIEPAISPPVPSPEIIKRVIEFNAPAEYPTPDHDVYIAVRVRCSIVDELVRGLRDSGFSTKMIDLP